MMPGIWTSLQGGTLWHIMDGLDILNDKPRKSLVKQNYDTGDNPIETVEVRYRYAASSEVLEVRLWLYEKIL